MHITPQVKESLNSKTIASSDSMMKVFSNQFLQEKLDLVDVKLKRIENKGILIESEVWIRFIWAIKFYQVDKKLFKLYTDFSLIKGYRRDF